MSDLCVFTCNYDIPFVDSVLLQRSAETLGMELHAYGSGNFPGFGIGKVRDAITFLQARDERYCLYTDCSDAFIARADIMDAYDRVGAPDILLSGETNCYPDADRAGEYPASDSPWKYINAGGWMGERSRVLEALEEIWDFTEDKTCDQRMWTRWFLGFHEAQSRAKIDTVCHVFQTGFSEGQISDKGVNLVTGNSPCVFHFNGRVPGRREWYYKLRGEKVYE